MRVLVTGHDGYIGSLLVPLLQRRGHEVVGLDTGLFAGCALGAGAGRGARRSASDIRDVSPDQLAGFDAVVHLAGISNDPLGDLNPDSTYDINHRGTVRAGARAPRRRACARFVFSSSCSNYGAAGDDLLDETAAFNPVTPYGRLEGAGRARPGRAGRRHASARRSCATPRRTGCRRGCAATSSSTTCRATPSRPARCSSRATARRGGRSSTSRTSRARSSPRSRRRATPCTTRRSTSGRPPRTTASATSASSSRSSFPAAASCFGEGAGPDMRNYRCQLRQARRDAAGMRAALDGARTGSRSCATRSRRTG